MHDPPVEKEILMSKYVLLVVTVRLNPRGLRPQLPVLRICHIERLPDLPVLLATPVNLVLQPLSPQSSHLLYLNPLHIGYYLLMLPHCTNRLLYVVLYIVACVEQPGVRDYAPVERRHVVALLRGVRRRRATAAPRDGSFQGTETLPIHERDFVLG